ncbi:MAG: hypothetical protein M5U33_01095 [Pseudorhodoplanes sp.]|nr:hypothetical protein [Pseudorhodoplanes sp.]MCQ3942806.1 hypothetical protein [Alphaproteobacteria bacterium]MBW7948155.1 hypothetical protein [Pseudorhodoplanes sp.]MCL4710397.1 hypothetical protein [Pseudorhodoplanes sp.]MCZ7641610.1 hypothetical protein [Pseudorhodoplanes sp.]
MRKGLAISAVLHAIVLLWGMLTFNVSPFETATAESVPVDFISEQDFSKLTAGTRDAPKPETPKPLVEKVAEKKPAPEPAEKITEKKEIVTASTAEPPPPAEDKKPEKADKKPEPKVDPIAEALKKEEKKEKPEPKKAETTPLPPRKRPPTPQPKFDPAKVAALLDKRTPQRTAATGEEINRAPSLGAPSGNAPQLSQSELDALRARLMQLWNPPVGIINAGEMIIRIRVLVGRDGRLTAPPTVLTSGRGTMFESARDSAIRAVFRAQPFDMLRQETYETWRDMEITFDPRDMFRG